MLLCSSCFLLCRLKINQVTFYEHAFILEQDSLVATAPLLYIFYHVTFWPDSYL